MAAILHFPMVNSCRGTNSDYFLKMHLVKLGILLMDLTETTNLPLLRCHITDENILSSSIFIVLNAFRQPCEIMSIQHRSTVKILKQCFLFGSVLQTVPCQEI